MGLVRCLVLSTFKNNILINAIHILVRLNDVLSLSDRQKIRALCPRAEEGGAIIPDHLLDASLISKTWKSYGTALESFHTFRQIKSIDIIWPAFCFTLFFASLPTIANMPRPIYSVVTSFCLQSLPQITKYGGQYKSIYHRNQVRWIFDIRYSNFSISN